jgi:chromosomal replication initiation ATPase DnaA
VDGPDDEPTEDLDLPADDSRSLPQARAPAPAEPDPVVSEIPLDELLETVARDGGLTLEDLRGRQRGGEIAAARCRAAYLARRLFRIPVRRVAMRLGRDDSSFARPLPQLESRLELDPALQATIDRLTRLLRTAATPQIRNQD